MINGFVGASSLTAALWNKTGENFLKGEEVAGLIIGRRLFYCTNSCIIN